MSRELSYKQLQFLQFYRTNGRDAKRAAAQAGYDANKWHRVIAHPAVAAELARDKGEEPVYLKVTKDRIIKELMCVAFNDPASMYDDEGNMLPINRMPEHARRAIQGVRLQFNKAGVAVPEIRLNDKLKALQMLSAMLGYDKPSALNDSGKITELPSDLSADRIAKIAGLPKEREFIEDLP